jgi:hypothetical protein
MFLQAVVLFEDRHASEIEASQAMIYFILVIRW